VPQTAERVEGGNAAVDAVVFAFWHFLHAVFVAGAFSLSETHAMIHILVN
jgi:hypothetical protein